MSPLEPRTIRYVFLDRDGVLNRKMPEGVYLTQWDQFEWLPGAMEAVSRMNRAHYTVILVTNQRGIALGVLSEAVLKRIHTEMQSDLARNGAQLDAIFYCPHDRDQCHCRKPETGLFEQAFQLFPQANPDNSVVIGDSLSDIEAGARLGMKTIFLWGDPDRRKPGAEKAAKQADAIASSLLEAVELHLGLGRLNGSSNSES